MIAFEKVRWSAGRFILEIDAHLDASVTGVFGPSGSGKTTLIELVAGLRHPSAGRILVDGTPLSDATTRVHLAPERRHIGYVPQDGALFPHLSVAQNLRYGQPRRAAREPADSAAETARFSLEHVAELLGIASLLSAQIAGLSGGERQRVALARALLSHPRLLLLDEPLVGLDAARREAILPYLRRVRDEFALPMLYVSHAPEEILALCDEVLVLDAGRVVGRGSPAELFVPTGEPRYRLREPS